MRRFVWIVLALSVIGASAAQADGAWLPPKDTKGMKGDWEIGVFLGYFYPDDYGVRPFDDWIYGFRFGYYISGRWQVEASYNIISTEVKEVISDDDSADMNAIRVSGLFQFRPRRLVRPYVSVHIGVESFGIELISQSEPGYGVGGGMRIFPTQNMGARLDLDYTWTTGGVAANPDALPGESAMVELDDDQLNLDVSVGFFWIF
jgi:opacity protein-like surface antigen